MSFLLVSVILLHTSVTLGLVVLIGVPVLMLFVGPLLAPLQRRSARQRELTGDLSNTANDIVGGLRVLRGIGGEQVFHDRYRRESQTTRRAGVEVAKLQSVLDALQVFLPGVFVVVVVWIGARYAVSGRITAGELVAFYGYAAFLMIPLRTATEYANKFIRARVSASRVCRVLALTPDVTDPAVPADPPPPGAALADARSGLRVRPGAAHRDRERRPGRVGAPRRPARRVRARSMDDDVTLGGVPLTALARAEVRRRIVVSDTGATLFSGRLGDRLDVDRHRRPRPARWTPRRPTTSSTRCPRVSTRSSPSAAAASPAVSGSGWCWRGRSRPTPRSWSWSSRPRRSTPTPRPGSPRGCGSTAPAGPPWSPRPAR